MTPKHWIPVEKDRPEEGQLRIVKLENGRLRAAKWRLYGNGSTHGYYADSRGDGIDGVVEVGASKPKRKASGPSGVNLVPERKLRVPDEEWEQFGEATAACGTNRTAAIRQFMRDFCSQTGTVRPAS